MSLGFNYQLVSGDISASAAGTIAHGTRLAVGDIAGVTITDPDVSLAGITITYQWFVNNALYSGPELVGPNGSGLHITSGMAGEDIHVVFSFTHTESSPAFTTEFEKGQFNFNLVNSGPVAVNDNMLTVMSAVHTGTSVNLLGNDSDPTGDALSVVGFELGSVGAAHTTQYGTVELDANGQFQYHLNTSDPDYIGLAAGQTQQVTLQYTISDGFGATAHADVHFTILGENDAPSVTSVVGTVTAAAGQDTLSGALLLHDPDPGDTPFVHAVSGNTAAVGATFHGQYGDLKIDSAGHYTYSVDLSNATVLALTAEQHVTELIHTTVSDGAAHTSGNVVVVIHGVNDAPTVTVPAFALTDSAGYNVLSGNLGLHDPDSGDSAHIVGINGQTNLVGVSASGVYGGFDVTASGHVAYSFNVSNPTLVALTAGQHVTEHIQYTASDGTALVHGTFDIVINGVNETVTPTSPTGSVFLNNDTAYVSDVALCNTSASINVTGNVLSSDSSPNPLRVGTIDGTGIAPSGYVTLGGAYGTLTMYGDGHYSFHENDAALNALSADFHTTLTYQLFVTDNADGGGTEFLYIDVAGADDAPNATFNISDNVSVTAAAGLNMLTGDLHLHDPDTGDTPYLAIGSATGPASHTVDLEYGTLHINGSGHFHYTANLANPTVTALAGGQHLTDTFHYTVSDGTASATGNLDFYINGAYQAPTVHDNTGTITDLSSYYLWSASQLTGDVFGNDDSTSPLHIATVTFGTQTEYGTAWAFGTPYGTLNLTQDGGYHFSYNSGAINALPDGASVQLDFTLHVTNGHDQGAIEHLYIQVNGANDVPVNQSATATATLYTSAITPSHTQAFAAGYLGSDGGYVDPEGNSLQFSLSGQHFGTATSDIAIHNSYGTFHLTNGGHWTFTLDATSNVLRGIGASGTALHFDVGVSDQSGGLANVDLVVNIVGQDDSPNAVDDWIYAPTTSGSYEIQGNLLTNDTDPDIHDTLRVTNVYGSSSFLAPQGNVLVESEGPTPLRVLHNNYGTLSVWADGHYTLDIDPRDPDYLALSAGQTAQLHYSYTISDGHDAHDYASINIVITGVDHPVIAYDTTDYFYEDYGSYTTTNTVSFFNPHSGTAHVVGASALDAYGNVTADFTPRHVLGHDWYTITNEYGTLRISSSGAYSFTLDNNSTAVQSLGYSQTHVEQYDYVVSDGLGGTDIGHINIVVSGTNDAPHAHDDSFVLYESGLTPSGYAVSGYGTLDANVLTNDTDIDQNSHLHVVNFNRGSTSTPFYTTYGSASLDYVGDLHYHLNQGAADSLAAGEQVTIDFRYKMADSSSAAAGANISIVIVGENDAPTVYGNITDTSLVEDSITGVSGTFYLNDVDHGDVPLVHSVNGATAVTVTTTSDSGVRDWISVAGLYGTLHMNVDGAFHYDLNAGAQALAQGETACETFTFTVSDGHGGHAYSNLYFDIAGANDAPVASDFNFSITADASTNLLSHVNDVDHGAVVVLTDFNDSQSSISTTIDTAFGTVFVNASGQLSFNVDESAVAYLGAGESTHVTFSYGVSDSFSYHDTGHISIVINGVNDLPTLSADYNSMTQDAGSVSGNVLANDHDQDLHDVLIVANVTATNHILEIDGRFGYLTVAQTGHYQYHLTATSINSLAAGSFTYDTFHLSVTDQHGGLAGEFLTITINGVNDAPSAPALALAGHDSGTVSGTYHSGTSLTVDLAGAVIDADFGDSAHVVGIASSTDAIFAGAPIVTPLGSATVDGSGILHFHVDQAAVDHLAAGATDNVTIAYKVADLSGSTDINTVTITVTGGNDAPTAQHSSASVTAGASTAAAGAVSFGDVDDGDSVHVASVNGATFGDGTWTTVTTSYGHLYMSRSGAYSFTVDTSSTAVAALASGQVHHEQFTYHVADLGGLTASATIDIAITGINDAPLAVSHTFTAVESGTATVGADAVGALLGGAVDVDHDSLHVVGLSYGGGAFLPSLTVPYGSASITSEGHFHFHPDESAVNGLGVGTNFTFDFDYKISDGNGGTDISTVHVLIEGVNDAPTAASVSQSMTEDTPNLTGNLLLGAGDPDSGDSVHLAHINGGSAGAHISGSHGWLSFTAGGEYHYHLDVAGAQHLTALESTVDTFTYTVADSHGGTTTAQLNITIDGQNDNPVAVSDLNTVTEAANYTGTSSVTGDVLLNDSVGGVSQSVHAVSLDGISIGSSTAATATGNFGHLHLYFDGHYTYALDNANGAVDALNTGDVLVDTFSYKASDGFGHWATTDISITINGVDDAPVATSKGAGDAYEAGVSDSGAAAVGNLMSVIVDVDNSGAQLSVHSVSGMLVGTGLDVSGVYGKLHVTGHGNYTYDVSDLNATVNALQTGDSLADCFVYHVQDANGGMVTNTIDITIHGHDDAPNVVDVAMSAAEAGFTFGGIGASGNFLAPATDPENDLLFVAGVNGATNNVSTDIAGNFGSLSITASGHYHYVVNETAADFLAYGSSTTDTFTVLAGDGHGGYDLANIVITINGENDAPVALDDTFSMTEQGVATHTGVISGTVLANDHDVDVGDIKLHVVSLDTGFSASNGIIVETGVFGVMHMTDSGHFTFQLDQNNATIQALNTGDTVTDTFHYVVSDGHGGFDTASIPIVIHGANDAATFTGSLTGSVHEAGGVANTTLNVPSASGFVTVYDVDNADSLQTASGTANFGTFQVTADGWYYAVDNANLTVEALNSGDTLTDTFDIHAVDGTVHSVVITINGANDAAVIGGTLTGVATEAGGVANGTAGAAAGGTATAADVDNTANAFLAASGAGVSGYGSWSIDAAGAWTYTVDDSNAAVQALNSGDTLTDSFTIHSQDGTAQVINVTINGANDAATIGGATTGTATEAGGVANGTAGSGASGTATATDVDNTANAFLAASGAGVSGYGSWGVNASGAWTYTVDDSNASVQALNTGGTLSDTFTIHSVDGTAQVITVTINGANDAAVIGGATTGSATEAGGVANGTAGAAASGTATATDVDNTANAFLAASGAGVSGYGSWSVNASGAWTYTVDDSNAAVQALNVGGTLSDSFIIQSQDGTAQVITVTINGANDAAAIGGTTTGTATEAGGVANGTAGTGASGTATATDVDNTANAFQAASGAGANGYGSWAVNASGAWTYTVDDSNASVQALNTGGTLSDTFTIHSQDGTAQVITVTINGANDAATIGGATTGSATEAGGVANATAGSSATGTATAADVDNAANAFQAASGAGVSGYGSWSVSASGAWTYTVDDSNASVQALNTGGTLSDSFTIHSQDGTAQVITVTINGANDAATIGGATTGSATEAGGVGNATAGSAASGTATATDIDNTANAFQAASGAGASGYGSWSVDAAGAWTYTVDDSNASVQALNTGGTLSDTFTIHSQDGTAQVITVTINGANDAAVIGGATSGNAVEAGGVANGTPGATATGTATAADVDNTANAFQAVSAGTASSGGFGTWGVTSGGAWTYTVDDSNAAVQALNSGGTLLDTFTIHSQDGTAQVVTVTIHGANDAATIGGTTTGSVLEAGGAGNATPGAPTANGTVTSTDPDNAANTFVAVAGATASANGYGTFTVTSGGLWTYNLDNSNAAVDALAQGATLTDTFSVQAIDGTAQTVTITIHGANDNPVAHSETALAVEAGVSPGSSAVGNLLANDTDVDNAHVLSVANVELTAPTAEITGTYGVLHVTGAGHYTYMLDDASPVVDMLAAGDMVTETFSYVVQDENGGTASAQLVVHVDGANDAPVANADTGSATEAGIVAGSAATGNVLPNDTDPDNGATLTTQAATIAGLYGTLVMNGNGQYTYTVNDANSAVNALAVGETLVDTLTYTLVDEHGATSSGSLAITINGADDHPDAVNDTGTAGEEGETTSGFDAIGNVLPNDSDPDHAAAFTVMAVNGSNAGVATAVDGAFGQLTLNADGTYTYVVDDALPQVDALGPSGVLHDIFTYTVSDGLGGTSSAQLDITIQGANDAPQGSVAINGTTQAGSTLTVDTSGLSDPEGLGVLHYQWTSDGFDIAGANSSSFTVTESQLGTIIGVTVTYVDGGGTSESVSASVFAVPGEQFIGTGRSDLLIGTAGNDTLDGGLGRDTMVGGAGDDVYYVNIGSDVVTENANEGTDSVIASASYTLSANVENLTLTGTAATATGNDLANVIIGDRANNVITGNGGADTMTGGLGADTFVFKSLSDSSGTAYDTITDFNAAQKDKINLRAIDARDNVLNDQAFKFIGTAAFDPNANNTGLLRFDPVTHMLEGSVNADATVEFRILLIGVDHIGSDAGGISAANILL